MSFRSGKTQQQHSVNALKVWKTQLGRGWEGLAGQRSREATKRRQAARGLSCPASRSGSTHRAVGGLLQGQALHAELGDVGARHAAVLAAAADQVVVDVQHQLPLAALQCGWVVGVQGVVVGRSAGTADASGGPPGCHGTGSGGQQHSLKHRKCGALSCPPSRASPIHPRSPRRPSGRRGAQSCTRAQSPQGTSPPAASKQGCRRRQWC